MNQRSGHDLTDTIYIAGGVLFAFAGVLYLAGGLAILMTTGHWVSSPWIDALRVPLHPGNPAAAFGLTSNELAPAAYWLTFAIIVVVPLTLTYVGMRMWQDRKAGIWQVSVLR